MSQYDTAQRPPISHGIKSWYVELHATGFADCHDRKYIVYVRCACGESLSQVCDRIADDGWNEACAIIWQHEQGVLHEAQGFEAFVSAPNPNVPQQKIADLREEVEVTDFALRKVSTEIWGPTIREAAAYARLDAQLNALR
jgi:hypothetical protein